MKVCSLQGGAGGKDNVTPKELWADGHWLLLKGEISQRWPVEASVGARGDQTLRTAGRIMNASPTHSPDRSNRLMSFLEHDPRNRTLLIEAAFAAYDEGLADRVSELLSRADAIAPLSPSELNLQGLVALKTLQYAEAVDIFQRLMVDYPQEPSIGLNLAWATMGLRKFEEVIELLDSEIVASTADAATLKITAFHHVGRLEEALALGETLVESQIDNHALMAALAIVASDAEDEGLTRRYLDLAKDHPHSLATKGLVLISQDDIDSAIAVFDKALSAIPGDPRAMLGKGLGLLTQGDPAKAAECIDGAAAGFESHLGSWIAAGWAHMVSGDMQTARARFEEALRVDDTFSESHGALAVLDICDGDLEGAKRRVSVALRLDRECLSAALAKSLLMMSAGRERSAEKIRETALNLPVGPNGRTIAQALARYGAGMKDPLL